MVNYFLLLSVVIPIALVLMAIGLNWKKVPIMKKVKIYRILGWISFGFGFIGCFAILFRQAQGGKNQDYYFASFADLLLQFFGDKEIYFVASVHFGVLLGFVINPLLWAGLILLQRSDKNEYSDKKSSWSMRLMLYGIFSLIVFIAAITYPVFVRLTQPLD